MKINDDHYEYIKAEIADLFERYDVHKFPVDPFGLAQKMNFKLEPYSSLDEYRLKVINRICRCHSHFAEVNASIDII